MNAEPLGPMADLIAAIIVMFAVPLVWCTDISQRITDRYVSTMTAEFVEKAAINEKITQKDYDRFVTEITNRTTAAGSCDIEISCARRVYEPVYEDGIFTDTITEFIEEIYTEEILDMIESEEGFCLRSGDVITVTVIRRQRSLTEQMFANLTGHDSSQLCSSEAVIM